MSNNRKTALVTGAAQRIGAEIVRELHRAGFDIALHYRNPESPAAAASAIAEELCEIRPDSCRLYQADLRRLDDIGRLADEVTAAHHSLDVLINNASGFSSHALADADEIGFDEMIGSNLKGAFFLVQATLERLRASGGCIVNIIDLHARFPLRDFNAYGAAKAGLASLTRSLALELGPEVRVNGIAPGAILWPQSDESYDEETRVRTIAMTPLKRLGNPTDIARTARFLCCDAPFITGQIITVDGGRSLHL